MKNLLKFAIPAVVVLALDYIPPVISFGSLGGREMTTTIAGSAGLCGEVSKSGFGSLSKGGPCDWTPVTHYALLGIAALLVGLGVRSMVTAKKAA